MARNTIFLKGDIGRRYEEGDRGVSVVKPGMLIDFAADGTIVPHATLGAAAAKRIAVEEAFLGGTVTTSYANAGDKVRWGVATNGEILQIILKGGQNAALNNGLASNGDGTFKVAAGGDVVLFKASEALNLTALGDALIAAEAID